MSDKTFPIFQSRFLNYSITLEAAISPQEAMAMGIDKSLGVRVEFGNDKRSDVYNPNVDKKLHNDQDKQERVSAMLKHPKYGRPDGFKIYDEGKEEVTMTKDQIDKLVGDKLKENSERMKKEKKAGG